MTDSQTLLAFHDLDSVEGSGHFAECSSSGICLVFFLTVRLGFCVLGLKTTEAKWHFLPSYQGCIVSTWLFTVGVDLGHLVEVVFSFSLSTPFHPVLSGRKSLRTPTLMGWELTFRLLEGDVLRKLFGMCLCDVSLLSLIYLCIQLFIYIWMDPGLLTLYSGLYISAILLLKSFQLSQWELFQLALLSHARPPSLWDIVGGIYTYTHILYINIIYISYLYFFTFWH